MSTDKRQLHDAGSTRTDEEILSDELRHAREVIDSEALGWVLFDSVIDAADGCRVERDGTCPHGYCSPLVVLGMI